MRERNKKGQFSPQGKSIIRNCKRCSKEFQFYESRLKRSPLAGNFCSISCSEKGRKKRLGVKHSLESRIKIGKNTPKYNGEKHWNWKGGITQENSKLRNSLEYIIWRNEIWKRDYWTCRICKFRSKGKKAKDIVAHHIQLFSEFPELRFSVENGLTLCRKCHIRIHKPNHHINHILNPN